MIVVKKPAVELILSDSGLNKCDFELFILYGRELAWIFYPESVVLVLPAYYSDQEHRLGYEADNFKS